MTDEEPAGHAGGDSWWSPPADDAWTAGTTPSDSVTDAALGAAGGGSAGANASPPPAAASVGLAGSPWGRPATPPAPTHGMGTRRVLALVTVVALLASIIGGLVGAALSGGGDNRDTGRVVDLGQVVNRQPAASAPGSVAAIASKILPSVVSINVKAADSSDTGSGVILSSDGYILTNNHVVSAAAHGGSISVVFYAKRSASARVVGRDAQSDLAVIKAQGVTGLRRADLGSSSSLRVGDPVVAIGSPLGLTGTVTAGIVSAKDRPVPTGSDDSSSPSTVIDAIQTDAAINPGNSGGALVSGTGAVVGINSAIATVGGSALSGGQGGNIGVGFAIPIDQARSIAAELIATGRATHPVIGVRAQSVDEDLARGMPGGRPGALVVSISAGSGAAQAGIRKDDLLTAIDGQAIASVDELIVAIRKHKVGDAAKVTYVRNGKQRTVSVKLGRD
jgi:putative serine protease PepD